MPLSRDQLRLLAELDRYGRGGAFAWQLVLRLSPPTSAHRVAAALVKLRDLGVVSSDASCGTTVWALTSLGRQKLARVLATPDNAG